MPSERRSRESEWWEQGLRRRDFLALLGAGAVSLMTGGLYAATAARRRPNVIVIVADDLGYSDLGCQGATDIPTPSIDSIARSGVRFTNAYVSCPVCSPTRAGLMTGRYQERFGHEFNAAWENLEAGLPFSQITLADELKAAGYATGLVGKWHLGMAPRFNPVHRGFDEFFGFTGGSHVYLDPGANPAPRGTNPILRGTETVDEKEYLTDALTREAAAYIDRHQREPFFLYLCYNAVHVPQQAPQNYLDRFSHIANDKRRTYAAMLSAMDDGVGAVLGRLREAGLEQDTLIFFLSDNGGPAETGSHNHPLRGGKGSVWEGGIRVPFLMQWKGRIKAGQTYDNPVIALDIFPTVTAAAGAKLPTDRIMDGVNLVPYVTGKRSRMPHEVLYWRYGWRHAIRRGNWKMRIGEEGAAPELYDLANDIGEANDLAQSKSELVQDLNETLMRWESSLVPPLWPPQAAVPGSTTPAPAGSGAPR